MRLRAIKYAKKLTCNVGGKLLVTRERKIMSLMAIV